MVRRFICILFFGLLVQTSLVSAGTEGSEELKGSASKDTASECFEGFSRAMFKFNMTFDDVILEPVAKGYNKLPNFVRAAFWIALSIDPMTNSLSIDFSLATASAILKSSTLSDL